MSVQIHSSCYQGKRGLWDKLKLKQAVNAVLTHGMSKKKATKTLEYRACPTLIRHVNSAQQGNGVQK